MKRSWWFSIFLITVLVFNTLAVYAEDINGDINGEVESKTTMEEDSAEALQLSASVPDTTKSGDDINKESELPESNDSEKDSKEEADPVEPSGDEDKDPPQQPAASAALQRAPQDPEEDLQGTQAPLLESAGMPLVEPSSEKDSNKEADSAEPSGDENKDLIKEVDPAEPSGDENKDLPQQPAASAALQTPPQDPEEDLQGTQAPLLKSAGVPLPELSMETTSEDSEEVIVASFNASQLIAFMADYNFFDHDYNYRLHLEYEEDGVWKKAETTYMLNHLGVYNFEWNINPEGEEIFRFRLHIKNDWDQTVMTVPLKHQWITGFEVNLEIRFSCLLPRDVEATKIWSNPDEDHPTVWFQLTMECETACGKKISIPIGKVKKLENGEDTVSWTLIPLLALLGDHFSYVVKEVDEQGEDFVPEGYEKKEEGLTVTNTKIEEPIDTMISIKAIKTWVTGPEEDPLKRPDIKLQLYCNDKAKGEAVIPELKDGILSYTWEKLSKFDDENNELIYRVEEVVDEIGLLKNYKQEISKEATEEGYIFTITNTWEPKRVSVKAIKIWITGMGEDPFKRPEVTLQLYRNDQPCGEEILLKNKTYSYTWEDLLEFDEKGMAYTYSVDEVNVPEGYNKKVNNIKNTFMITNCWKSDWQPEKPDPKDPPTKPKPTTPYRRTLPSTGADMMGLNLGLLSLLAGLGLFMGGKKKQ